jgi:hypothetical protein
MLPCTHGDIVSPISCALSCILAVFNFVSNSLYFGAIEIISFQTLVGNLDKMTVANLGRQHQKIFGLLFPKFLRIFVFVWNYMLILHTIYIASIRCMYFKTHITYVFVIPP